MILGDFHFEILSDKNSILLEDFTCQEDRAYLDELGCNKKSRRKIISHNNEIEDFLKSEALLEQKLSLNTTHLMIKDNELIGFVSLCNDCIPLEVDEKELYGFTYKTIPALKIARLAVASKYQRKGIANKLLDYVIYLAVKIREISGVSFITLDCYSHRLSFYKTKHGFIVNEIQEESKADDKPISMRMYIDEYLTQLYNT